MAEMNRQFLQLMAEDVSKRLPDKWTFIVLAAPVGEGGQLVYASNMKRADAINVLREFLIKASGPEEWLKHLK